MCLILRWNRKPEIAQEDMTCWKVIKPFDNYKWEAPYRCTVHNYDEVLTACDRLSVKPWFNGIPYFDYIEEGFYACTNEDIALYQLNNLVCFNSSHSLAKCTIPKGAEYCLGWYSEIVANKMIVHKPKEI